MFILLSYYDICVDCELGWDKVSRNCERHMNYITKLFGEFVADTQEVPASARSAATRCVLDSVWLRHRRTRNTRRLRRSPCRQSSLGQWLESQVWFSNHRLTEAGAIFANAAMACQLDLDDGHRLAAGHPGAAVIPSAFAIRGLENKSASELLTAICLGYEIAVRIAASRDLQSLPTTDSGQWCGAGAVAVAGKLKGSSARNHCQCAGDQRHYCAWAMGHKLYQIHGQQCQGRHTCGDGEWPSGAFSGNRRVHRPCGYL